MKNQFTLNFKHYFLYILVCVLIISCKDWQHDIKVHGHEFSKIRYEIKNNDTTLIIGFLKQDCRIDTIPCASGWIHFTKNWNVRLFRLSQDLKILNNELPKDTWVMFRDDNCVVCSLPYNLKIQNYLCKGNGGPKGIQTIFYPNGKLKGFYPPYDVDINGILCISSLFHPVYLYENGKLMECMLSREQNIHGVLYKKNTKIQFDINGKVIKEK